jgi:carbonic anhydrase
MHSYKILLENNRRWARDTHQRDPLFFQELSRQQTPKFLWIGCADSRVPANEIVGLKPGEVFVHRNVANIVSHGDLNCLSCLQYAVDVLRVRHVIVCGHYGCGGVAAVVKNLRLGLVDNWLRHIHDIAREHALELNALDEESRGKRLCELNILAQVRNVCESTILRDAWASGQAISVHGWIYSLHDGLLREISPVQTGLEWIAG